MQMKLLNVALATALTAVLTGCGSSDGDATYNKQTVAPIGSGSSSMTDAEAEAAKAKAEAEKAKAEAEKAKAEAEKAKAEAEKAKAEGNKKDDDKKDGKGDGKGDGNKKDDDAVVVAPVVEDPKNNVGIAANTDKTVEENNVVGFQAYDRGVASQFDRTLNPEPTDTGNSTVINHNELENKVLSNIVLARPSVNRVPKTIYAGERGDKVLDFDFIGSGTGELDLKSVYGGTEETTTLQNQNVSLVNYNNNSAEYTKDGTTTLTDGENAIVSKIFDSNFLSDLSAAGILGKEDAAKSGYKAIRPYQLSRAYVSEDDSSKQLNKLVDSDAKANNIKENGDRDSKFIANVNLAQEEKGDLQKLSSSAYKSGLVRTYSQEQGVQGDEELLGKDASKTKRFVVRGHDRAVTEVKKGKLNVLHRTGFEENEFVDGKQDVNEGKNAVRIFGSLYRDVTNIKGEKQTGDIPEQIWSVSQGKFVDNQKGNDKHYEKSQEIFAMSKGTPNSYQHTSAAANEDIKTLEELENKYFAGSDKDASRKFGQYRAGLTAKPIHLNHVQYGRVTVQGDDKELLRIQKELKAKSEGGDGLEKSLFNLANKYTKKNGESVANVNKKDTNIDYYFARGLQDTKDMPKEGKVTYLGHALAYGLDNSFHKESAAQDNTVIAEKKEGVGNFVRAEVDFKDATVKGSVYNVWIDADAPFKAGKGTAVENDLVILDGKITPNHNSVIGTASLAYGDKAEGAFKGAFYGKGAAELGGQFNSINEGYGKAKWGGVFGAQKVTSEKIDISNSTEQQNP